MIRAFLIDLDERWSQPETDKLPLKIIGSTALMLQASYTRTTKDGDILEADPLTPELANDLCLWLAKARPCTSGTASTSRS
jgi:hypothetical protein